jgi:hypothetical protein
MVLMYLQMKMMKMAKKRQSSKRTVRLPARTRTEPQSTPLTTGTSTERLSRKMVTLKITRPMTRIQMRGTRVMATRRA